MLVHRGRVVLPFTKGPIGAVQIPVHLQIFLPTHPGDLGPVNQETRSSSSPSFSPFGNGQPVRDPFPRLPRRIATAISMASFFNTEGISLSTLRLKSAGVLPHVVDVDEGHVDGHMQAWSHPTLSTTSMLSSSSLFSAGVIPFGLGSPPCPLVALVDGRALVREQDPIFSDRMWLP